LPSRTTHLIYSVLLEELMALPLLADEQNLVRKVELKTPVETWIEKPVNYLDIHIFGSHVYVRCNTLETTKLDLKSRKCLFLGYADGVKGYRLWDLTAHKVVVSRDVVFIEDTIQENEEGAHVLMKGEKVAANLYQLKGEIMEEAKASIASHIPSHRVAITWHQKLGHMSEQGIEILVERKLLPGLRKVYLPFCEHCVISKQHRLKFKTSNSRSVYVLELVHSDVYPIKKKFDVFEVFKVYKARVELDSGKKIKFLRTNNKGEYTGDEFDIFYRQEGIKRQFTTAYTP
nr:Gag-Pol polyprotein [Tanacetum cinerariifolium]